MEKNLVQSRSLQFSINFQAVAAQGETQSEVEEEVVDNDLNESTQYEHSEGTPSCSQAPQQFPRARNKGQKRRLELISNAVRELKDVNEKLQMVQTTTSSVVVDDECDVMGKHIAIQLRQLPVDERIRANFEIQRVLMDFRLRNITRPQSTTSSSTLDVPISPNSSILDISNSYIPEPRISDQREPSFLINNDIITAAMSNSDITFMSLKNNNI